MANNPPTTKNTNNVPKATPYTEMSSTDSLIRVAVCSLNKPIIHGRILFADSTIYASIAAITGFRNNERCYLLTIFLTFIT